MVRMLLVVTLLLSSWAFTFAQPIAFENITALESATTTKSSSSFVYIVQLADDPLATYDGGVVGLNATSPQSKGTRKLDVTSQDSINYRQYLQREQTSVLASAQQLLGESLDLIHTYDVAFNGFAVRITADQATQIAGLPGVLNVRQEEIHSLQTDAGPSFIGAVQDDFEAALYKAELSGANEVPPNDSTATGTGVFTYDAGTSTLTFNIATTGVEVGGPGAHIHSGAADENGPVEIDLIPFQVSPGVFIGSAELDDDQETALYTNELYVNIHSAEFTGGEIRGQIDPNKGEGMIVGIIDTGINYDHDSFADVGADGYDHTNPRGAGVYVGVCDPESDIFQASFECNDKLIGAWTWPATAESPDPLGNPSPADDDGHGSHVGSTAVGSVVEPSINGIDTGTLAGVAPHANIIAYDGCNTTAGCPDSALVASIDQAVADGVDVINYSIGGGSVDPWLSPDAVAFRNAFAAGVFSATAAGNDGPTRKTIGSPSNAPWVMSVAASTHDRIFENGVTNLSGGAGTPPADIFGKGFSGPLGETNIAYAGTAPYNNPLCEPFADGIDLSGLIVVCDRGEFGSVAKAANVADAGGVGYVLANDEDGGTSLDSYIYSIPGVHITFVDGVALKEWLASGTDHTAEIRGVEREISDDFGDIVADFSSRGPDATLPDVLKPDASAPGVDILAAVQNTDADESEYGFLSGTSMASPHAAGAAALVRQMHPAWSPAEVQSALMMTAVTEGVTNDDETPAGPFDVGAGRIDVSKAVQAGLIMGETAANHEAANPAEDGVPTTLNLPSMADSACVVNCTWSRTFTNALATEASWTITTTAAEGLDITVEPSSFTIPAGGEQTINISVDVEGLLPDAYVFGALVLTEDNDLAPTARLPLAVQPVGSTLPDLVEIKTIRPAGSKTITDVNAIAVEELITSAAGLVKGDQTNLRMTEDSDNSDIYDDLTDGIKVLSYEVPDSTTRFVTEVISSTAPDVDMYVHLDGSNESAPDGIPQEDELVCSSAKDTVLEVCDLVEPSAGTYLVLIQNWEGSEAAQDDITVSTGIVPSEDANNLTVTGPTNAIPSKTPFTLEVSWNVAELGPGDRWYGVFEAGTSAESPDSLGTVRVNVFNDATSYLNYLPIVVR